MYCFDGEPAQGAAVREAFASRAVAVRDFAPEIVFAFGPDHYTSMFQRLAPSFLAATRAEAIGDFVKKRGLRALFLGSGGLSHNPEPIFPAIGEGGEMVDDYMHSGPDSDDNRTKSWLDRLHNIHIEASRMLGDGQLTAEDCRFNPELDRECLDIIASGDLEMFDGWSPVELIKKAGIGSVELSCWIAAAAAHRAAGGGLPQVDLYAPVVEYSVAVGVAHG